jgi:CheY-like chemotaxis protein
VSITQNNRILVVDDSQSIHDDFRKILARRSARRSSLSAAEAVLFGDVEKTSVDRFFELDSAFQGQEALEMVRQARLRSAVCGRVRGCAHAARLGWGRNDHTSVGSRARPADRHLHRVFGLLVARHREPRDRAAQHGRAEEAVR